MNPRKIYTALLTADLAAAEAWYTKVLGRGPDNRPMDTLVQWELFDQGGLMLSSSDEIAGKGVMFVYVDDLAAERRRLQGLGIALGDDIPADYSTLAQLRDPDGNLITLATPPARPFRGHDRAGRAKSAETQGPEVSNAFSWLEFISGSTTEFAVTKFKFWGCGIQAAAPVLHCRTMKPNHAFEPDAVQRFAPHGAAQRDCLGVLRSGAGPQDYGKMRA
jgi:catechol 2,3-dioxygenase-like lactoylglutathione lyase family enzyme